MRLFTFSELWGPFPCEHPDCTKQTFTVILTDEENARLPEESGEKAAAFILRHKLGKAVCDEHCGNKQMAITKEQLLNCSGVKLILYDEQGRNIGHAYLYLLHNDLHQQPFGFVEDVFIAEDKRGQGLGTLLIQKLIKTAKELECYKLVATSRHSRSGVHQLYTALGFHDQGMEFRIDF